MILFQGSEKHIYVEDFISGINGVYYYYYCQYKASYVSSH